MNPSTLNGLTPEQLYERIRESPIGFSVEGGGIQFLGRAIHLKDGEAVLPEQSQSPTESKSMLDRLTATPENLLKPTQSYLNLSISHKEGRPANGFLSTTTLITV